MRELFDLTASESIKIVVDCVLEYHPELSKKTAKNLVINALVYNCVIEEIKGQIDFLLEDDD